MRLIDAKELLNERPETLNPNMNDEIKSAYNKGWNACNSEWISLIDDQPTAYDIEDIIKQLEKEKERQKENAIDRNYRFGVVNGLNVSIGIVKGGAE